MISSISRAVASIWSASTSCVSIATPVRACTLSAIASHLNLRREARLTCPKMSGFIAILCTATDPTPPAPMTRVWDMKTFYDRLGRFAATAVLGLSAVKSPT